jgi:hypothetical protein
MQSIHRLQTASGFKERCHIIFVREKGDGMGMMIADYEHGELDVVRMELSGDALAKWMKDPQGESRGRNLPH